MHSHTIQSWSGFPLKQTWRVYLEIKTTETATRCWFLQNRLSACPITDVEEPVCYNQRILASDKQFTMVNQLGPTWGRGSIKWKVLSLSWALMKHAGLECSDAGLMPLLDWLCLSGVGPGMRRPCLLIITLILLPMLLLPSYGTLFKIYVHWQ